MSQAPVDITTLSRFIRVTVVFAVAAIGWWVFYAVAGGTYRLCLALSFSGLTLAWFLAERESNVRTGRGCGRHRVIR